MLHLIIQTTSAEAVVPDAGSLDYTLPLERFDYEAGLMPFEYTTEISNLDYDLNLKPFHYETDDMPLHYTSDMQLLHYTAGDSNMAQAYCMKYGSTRTVKVSFLSGLDTGELLDGTPTVTVSGLTISNVAINTDSVVINGVTHVAGQAVLFSASEGTAGNRYEIEVEVDTDADPVQTFVETVRLTVE